MSKKLTYGVGYNSTGKYTARVNGRVSKAHYSWSNMMRRCYCPKYQKKYPTYIGCTVADEWHDFQKFAQWFYSQKDSGKSYALDKDLLIVNNKVYSPETCCFVPQELNKLLLNHASARGDLPQGVNIRKSSPKFRAKIRIGGKQEHLGYFNCPNEAYQTYKVAKEANVKRMALEWQDRIADNVFQALMNWELV